MESQSAYERWKNEYIVITGNKFLVPDFAMKDVSSL